MTKITYNRCNVHAINQKQLKNFGFEFTAMDKKYSASFVGQHKTEDEKRNVNYFHLHKPPLAKLEITNCR